MGRFLDFLGIEVRSGSVGSAGGDSPLPGIQPPLRSDTQSVSVDRAISIPTAYRAVTILAGAISQLELGVWRQGVELDPPPALVRAPDVNQTLSQFLKRTVIGLAGTGNAYWHLIRDSSGLVSSLEVLNPLTIHFEHDNKGKKRWLYGDNRWKSDDFGSATEVKHLRLLEVMGHEEGMGPIQACRSAFNSALQLRDYADNWFVEGGVPTGGVLTTDQHLLEGEAKAYLEAWKKMLQESHVAAMGKGLKYESIFLKPADAQFLEVQQFSVADIARMFGIPATYLLAEVNSNSLTYTNIQQVDTQFVKHTLMLYLKEIEDALSSVLVRGQIARFKLDGFLRPDPKSQSEILKTYVDLGVMSKAEARVDLGLTGPPPPQPKPVVVEAPPTEEPKDE